MTWYSKLFRFLLPAMVLAVSAGWCCSSIAAGQGLGGHVHRSASTAQDLNTTPSSPTHHGSDPSQTPDDHNDSGCQDEITMISTNFGIGTVYTDSGSYFQGMSAFVLSPDPMAWLPLSDRMPRGFGALPGTFRGDSLRALSCLATI